MHSSKRSQPRAIFRFSFRDDPKTIEVQLTNDQDIFIGRNGPTKTLDLVVSSGAQSQKVALSDLSQNKCRRNINRIGYDHRTLPHTGHCLIQLTEERIIGEKVSLRVFSQNPSTIRGWGIQETLTQNSDKFILHPGEYALELGNPYNVLRISYETPSTKQIGPSFYDHLQRRCVLGV